jgi:DNA-binding transcriptional MerR regulator
MNAFTIKDLENLSGIKAHTIRIWEQRYSFLRPQRTDTNIRYYNNNELRTILNVALLNKYGFKISHIDKMNDVEMNDRVISLSQVQAQQERIINELIQAMVDLETDHFETTLDRYISARGIERTISQIIFPFLEKIGILWATNHINPAQEHLVTNIIRQKLIFGIETINTSIQSNKTIVLFLPEGEHHELGLLFINYLLRSRGVKILYLGANVPVNDVEFLVHHKKPDFIYTHLTSLAHNFNFDKFLNSLSIKVKNTPVIISGQVTQQYRKAPPAGIQLKKSLSEVMEYISGL